MHPSRYWIVDSFRHARLLAAGAGDNDTGVRVGSGCLECVSHPSAVARPAALAKVPAMLEGRKPPDHPTATPDKIGVLLLNLGTPDSPDYWPMRRYLGEFLSDRRVIETNPVLW